MKPINEDWLNAHSKMLDWLKSFFRCSLLVKEPTSANHKVFFFQRFRVYIESKYSDDSPFEILRILVCIHVKAYKTFCLNLFMASKTTLAVSSFA